MRIFTDMRTTIDLPDPLFREAKTRAVQSGMKFKDLVAQYIEQGLHGQLVAPDSQRREQVSLPVFRKTSGTAIPARSNAELFEILEEEETQNNSPS
jgi:hypothetical protein